MSKKTSFWAKKFQQVYRICNLNLQMISVMKICLYKKNIYQFRILGKKTSEYRWKKFESVVETTCYLCRERFEEIGYLDQFFVSFYKYRFESEKKSVL